MFIAPVDATRGEGEWRPFLESHPFGHLVVPGGPDRDLPVFRTRDNMSAGEHPPRVQNHSRPYRPEIALRDMDSGNPCITRRLNAAAPAHSPPAGDPSESGVHVSVISKLASPAARATSHCNCSGIWRWDQRGLTGSGLLRGSAASALPAAARKR